MDSVTICNLALNMLGIPQITSFDEENNSAKLCKNFFPISRDRVLRDHTWSFAAASTPLQAIANAIPFDPEFLYVCSLPPDLIRINEVFPDAPYRIFGNRIFVPFLPLTLVYTRRVEDSALFDETFAEALQYKLAVEIGMANTRDPQLINFYSSEYERRIALARSIDSRENRHSYQPASQRSSWIASRLAPVVDSCPAGKLNWVEGNAGKQV